MIETSWQASDVVNVTDAFLASLQYIARQVIFQKFLSFQNQGSGQALEQFQAPVYASRAAIIWIEPFNRTYDQQRNERIEPESLNIVCPFPVQGSSPAVSLQNSTVVSTAYGGDQIIWNGKLWVVSDQVEPVQAGALGPIAFWKTQIRYTGKTGQGTTTGS